MTSARLAPLALTALLLAACKGEGSQAAYSEASAPSVAPPTPIGMASAATLIAVKTPPESLAKLHHPKELALGGGALFVLDTPTDSPDQGEGLDVVTLPLAPGGAAKILFSKQRGAEGLAYGGGRPVWVTAPSDDGKQHSMIVAGKPGVATASNVTRTIDTDETLAVSDGTDVFAFGDGKDAKGKPASPSLLRIGADGKTAVVATSTGALVRTALAVGGANVVWVQGGSIVKAPKAGGDVTTVAKLPSGKVQRLAADDTAVYWTDSGTGDPQWSGRVYRAALADGKVDTLSDAPSPFGIAVNADSIYWTSSADVGGKVMARKKAGGGGGETRILAQDQHGPRGIAVDDKYVYWVNAGDGSVSRVDKAAK
jgi:hypothetical protein